MRLALIMSHADRSMTGALRELHFLSRLRGMGVEAAAFRIHGGRAIERESFLDGAVDTIFCPEDLPAPPIPHRKTSAAMLETLRGFAPDLLIFKGLSYDINAFLLHGLGVGQRYGFIVGGSIRDRVLDGAEFVFGEYEEQLERHFPAFAAQGRVYVMPKYIDLEATRPEPAAPLHDIVNVGNFREARKNQAMLLPLTRDWRVALVGGGNPSEALRQGALSPGHLSLPGQLSHAQLFPLLKRCRLMVHCSTMDGLPRAMVEGMACGLPVIACRDTVYGGLTDGTEGLLVEREALLPAVEALLRDEPRRRRMGESARALVERRHGPPAISAAAERFMAALAARA
ncbi:glycosyltransferase family 4 protein [Teichococcus aerofrigidensis]